MESKINIPHGTERVVLFDILKGILIILVVIGHIDTGIELLNRVIFWFHMPCFFIVSGILFKDKANISFLTYLKQLLLKYMIPFISFYILFTILNRDFEIKHLFGVFYGGRAIAGVYWYVNCLLICNIILRVLIQCRSRQYIPLLSFVSLVIGLVWGKLLNSYVLLKIIPIPWNLDVALVAFFFFSIGYLIRNSEFCNVKKSIKIIANIISIVAISVAISSAFKHGDPFGVDMKHVQYGGGIWIVIVFAIYNLLYIAANIVSMKRNIFNTFLCKIGERSGIIMYFHMYLIQVLEQHIPQTMWWMQVVVTVIICWLFYELCILVKPLKVLFVTGYINKDSQYVLSRKK